MDEKEEKHQPRILDKTTDNGQSSSSDRIYVPPHLRKALGASTQNIDGKLNFQGPISSAVYQHERANGRQNERTWSWKTKNENELNSAKTKPDSFEGGYVPPSLRKQILSGDNNPEAVSKKPFRSYSYVVRQSEAQNQPGSLTTCSGFKRANLSVMSEKHFKWLLDGPALENGTKRKINTAKEAANFVGYILTSENKLDTLSRLSSSVYGLQAVQEAFSVSGITTNFIKQNVISLISYLGKDDRMTLGSARGMTVLKILRTIFNVQGLFEQIVKLCLVEDGQECLDIGWLVLQLVKSGDEAARQSPDVAELVKCLENSQQVGAKNLSKQISNFLLSNNVCSGNKFRLEGMESLLESQPGWRHENDKESIHSIALYPSREELLCLKAPFLPKTGEIFGENATIPRYFDWVFRLLREDVLRSVHDELDILLANTPPSDRNASQNKLLRRLKSRAVNVSAFSSISSSKHFGLGFGMTVEEPQKFENQEEREKYWKRRRNFLREQSVLALIHGDRELFCLGIVTSSQNLSCEKPKVDVLLFGKAEIHRTVAELGLEQASLRAVQLSASFFAYIPILERLQSLSDLPFEEEILHYKSEKLPGYWDSKFERLMELMEIADPELELKNGKKILLDPNQKEAVVSSLKRRVSLIQGPPGTGKSFCGAIIAKLLNRFTQETILCVCYTNHALDQFLQDLIEFGLPEAEIVRVGGAEKMSEQMRKFTVQSLLEKDENCNNFIFPRIVTQLRAKKRDIKTEIKQIRNQVQCLQTAELMGDFSSQFTELERKAFLVPQDKDGFQMVAKKNKLIRPDYLWRQWISGRDRGSLKGHFSKQKGKGKNDHPWSLSKEQRLALLEKWRQNLLDLVFFRLDELIRQFNEINEEIGDLYRQQMIDLLKSKRIIGCTSTGAAIYAKELDAINAGILIIEEAGELLEPHVIASLANNCKSLIMIGDHQQLRPKLNSFGLSVESGSSYDFNRSLFERLVLNNYPHVTLQVQHRMRPDFSSLIRKLTYPELKDAEKVQNRPNLVGVASNLVFIQHEQAEGAIDFQFSFDHQSVEDSLSKVNHYEIAMVEKIVQYLLLQGYRSDQIVVLTPYLGQLHHLRDCLSKTFEISLNEIDFADIVRIGFDQNNDQEAQERPGRTRIRVATVDNFQGEEADIIVASLVRSNKDGIVGFVGQPQRVNVLLSRAKLGMILVGNLRTFENASSRVARDLWANLLEMLNEKKAIFPGFPAHCDRHDRDFLLTCPEDFEAHAIDGGCGVDCGKILKCGHLCPMKCHRNGHTEIQCKVKVDVNCPERGHPILVPCSLASNLELVRCEFSIKAVCPRNVTHSVEIPCKFAEDLEFIRSHCETEVEHTCQNGHIFRQKCNENAVCVEEVEVTCQSGHTLKVPCPKSNDLQFIGEKCAFEVEVRCKSGNHPITVPCHRSRNLDDLICEAEVDALCRNGHPVKVPCRYSADPSRFCKIGFEVSCEKRGHKFTVPCSISPLNLLVVECMAEVELTCTRGHVFTRPCHVVSDFDHIPKCVFETLFPGNKEKSVNSFFGKEDVEKLSDFEIACLHQPECVDASILEFDFLLDSALIEAAVFLEKFSKFVFDKFDRSKFLLDIIFDFD